MIAACLALAVWAAVPVLPDSLAGGSAGMSAGSLARVAGRSRPDSLAAAVPLPMELTEAGGLVQLSDDPARPVEPAGLAFDSFGRLHVSDAALRRVVRWSAQGVRLGESGALGDDAGTLRRPGAMATAGVLAVAVLDEENRRIVRYDLQGHVQGNAIELDAPLEGRGESRARPIALASDPSGALYVADADGDRILRLEPSGELSRVWGGPGSTAGGLRGVAGVAVARRGEVFVSERMPGRIVRLEPTGALSAEWLLPDSVASERLPLAVDDSLRVACADPHSGRLWVFRANGELLAARQGFEGASALVFARDGALWVALRNARRLVRLQLNAQVPPAEP